MFVGSYQDAMPATDGKIYQANVAFGLFFLNFWTVIHF